LFSCFFFFSIY